jgi:hypothetical protein
MASLSETERLEARRCPGVLRLPGDACLLKAEPGLSARAPPGARPAPSFPPAPLPPPKPP